MNSANYKPEVLDPLERSDKRRLRQLKQNRDIEIIEALPDAIEDLFKIEFPFISIRTPEYERTFKEYQSNYLSGKPLGDIGLWIYFPWRSVLIHLPCQEDYFKLRTARNKLAVSEIEQRQSYESTIGVAGLSVGSWAVHCLALSAIGNHFRLADHDSLTITNLNRLQAGVTDLTRNKTLIMARRVYELDPFATINVFPEGLRQNNAEEFFTSDKPLNLFIEEMDDIKLKIESRILARRHKIPTVMASDNGDNVILDIERFDLEPKRPLFHGAVDESLLKKIPEKPTLTEKANLAIKIVGTDLTPAIQRSMMLVGSQLSGIPQLATGANLTGICIAYVAKRILTGKPMPSGRYIVNLDSLLDPTFHDRGSVVARKQEKEDFEQAFNLVFGEE